MEHDGRRQWWSVLRPEKETLIRKGVSSAGCYLCRRAEARQARESEATPFRYELLPTWDRRM